MSEHAVEQYQPAPTHHDAEPTGETSTNHGRFTSAGALPPVGKTSYAQHATASDKGFGAHTPEQAMRALVADVEGRARKLATESARGATMIVAADAIAQHFAATTSVLPKDSGPLYMGALQRIDAAMSILFQLGRRGHLRMRESHLERAFDAEDELRKLLGAQLLRRAEHYYEDTAPTSERAPMIGELHDGLVGDAGDGEKPSGHGQASREVLLGTIMNFAHELGRAIDLGFHAAAAIIKEPPPPKRPELLEALAVAAAGMILAGASGALGVLIGGAFKSAASAPQAEAPLGKVIGALLQNTFKGTKDLIASGGAVALDRANPHPKRPMEGTTVLDNDKLTPKTIFIERARGLAAKAVGATEQRFLELDGQLKRQPTETLAALSQGFGPAVTGQITEAFAQLVVREWVNYSKSIADATPTTAQLNMDKGRVGVLEIHLEAKGSFHSGHVSASRFDRWHFDSAKLHGIDPAVIDNLKNQPYTLATIPVARKVHIRAENGAIAEFQIDHLGASSFPYPHISTDARDLLALVGKLPIQEKQEPTEGHAWGGVHATIAALSGISAYRIEGDE